MEFMIRCIEPKMLEGRSVGFTKNGLYKVVDGKIIDDDNVGRPVMSKTPITSIEDIRDFKEGKWSWIGMFELVGVNSNSKSVFFRMNTMV